MASSRSDLLRMGAVMAALLLVTGAVLLLTQGGSGSDGTTQKTLDGQLTSVTDTQLVLQPAAGGTQQTFEIRPIDQRRLDLFHLREHMEQGLPSRVFYEQDGARRFAVRVDDLPAPAGG